MAMMRAADDEREDKDDKDEVGLCRDAVVHTTVQSLKPSVYGIGQLCKH